MTGQGHKDGCVIGRLTAERDDARGEALEYKAACDAITNDAVQRIDGLRAELNLLHGSYNSCVNANVEEHAKNKVLTDQARALFEKHEAAVFKLDAADQTIVRLTKERDEAQADHRVSQKLADNYCTAYQTTVRERDEARGKAAYMIEAFWLAIADLPHSDECDITTCSHQQPVCDHVNVDCTCPDACECECTCWRAAQSKALDAGEAVQLCTKLRDADDEIEALKVMLARMFAWAVLGREGREADLTWLRDYNAVRAKLGKKEGA